MALVVAKKDQRDIEHALAEQSAATCDAIGGNAFVFERERALHDIDIGTRRGGFPGHFGPAGKQRCADTGHADSRRSDTGGSEQGAARVWVGVD